MDPEEYTEAAERLERAYLAGGMSADEYTRRRRELEEGISPTFDAPAAEAAPAPEPEATWAPMPRLSGAEAQPVAAGADPISGARLASWGRRAGGWFVDLFVYIAAWIAVGVVDSEGVALSLIIVFGPALYAWLMVGRWGQTLGKMAVGIKVVRSDDGTRVSYLRALARAASVWILGLLFLPLLLAYFWPLWDRRNQTLYDKMAGTIVVVP